MQTMGDAVILYRTDDGRSKVNLMARDGNVWLNQSQMAELFATSKQNISTHIDNILSDRELSAEAVVKNYLTTASDGKEYTVKYFSLEMVLAVGFRIRNPRGVQFRQWANSHLSQFLRKGFVMDDERMKNPGGMTDYFDELLERIRDIRASEKRFYQKIRDIFALCSDYDKSDKATQMFFAETQNKLLYGIIGQTAAEIIVSRADATQPNMNLTAWKGRIVRKGDVAIAKNYLREDELSALNQLVVIFLDSAEFRVRRKKDLTMSFWRANVDSIIASHGLSVPDHAGKYSASYAETVAHKVYDEFDARRKANDALEADLEDLREIEALESEIKQGKH